MKTAALIACVMLLIGPPATALFVVAWEIGRYGLEYMAQEGML